MVDITTPAAYCPNCGAEYRTGFDVCADCGSELLRGPAPVEAQPEGNLVSNAGEDPWTTANRRWLEEPNEGQNGNDDGSEASEFETLCSLPKDEAYLLSGLLVDAGIDSQVGFANHNPYLAPPTSEPYVPDNWMQVLVPRRRLKEAAEIARAYVK